MNWTEGNLARHSRNRKRRTESLRQKEHFAKVRAGLLNPKTNISPPSISLFSQAPFPITVGAPRASKTNQPSSSRISTREALPTETSQYFTNINVDLPTPASFQKEQAEVEALRRKRQELLMMKDWVGTDLQKPIQLEFSKPRTSLDNPWGSSRSNRHSSKQRLRHLLGLGIHNDSSTGAKISTKNPAPISRGRLKVRVGAREKVLGGSSCISMTLSPRERRHHDADASSIGHTQRQSLAQRRSSRTGMSMEKHGVSGPGSYLQDKQPASSSSSSSFLPSSPLLHHPVPCRPTLTQLLRSHSVESETVASNVAQVGPRKPDMSISQRDENEAWRGFVIGSPKSLTPSDLLFQNGSPPEPLISPGVSQFEPPERAAGHDAIQTASDFPLTSSFDGNQKNSKPTTENLPCVSSPPGCVSLGPFGGSGLQGNASPSSSCADPHSFGEMPFGIVSEASPNQDVAIARGGCHPQTMDPKVLLSNSSTTGSDYQASKIIQRPIQMVGNPSLLALPSSKKPLLNLSKDMPNILSCSLPLVQGKEASAERNVEEARMPSHNPNRQQRVPETTEALELGDESDLWRKFVFGESSDGVEKALEDARKQTARAMRPSITPSSSSDGIVNIQQSCLGENGSVTEDRSSVLAAEDSQAGFESTTSDFDVSSTNRTTTRIVPANCIATAGNSSPDPLSEEFIRYPNSSVQTNKATCDASSSSSTAPVDTMRDAVQRSKLWTSTSMERNHDPNPTRSQPAKERHKSGATFKFVQPKPFLGRKTGHIDEKKQISLSTPQIRGKNSNSRRQRRRKDGRTAIRQLPDCNDDPIEDFGDSQSKDTLEQSIFGSLEVETSS